MARRVYFPHQLSWLIDNPLRRFVVSPERFADQLPIADTSRILELGPGSGYFSPALARRIPRGRLELIDLQPEMLAKVRRKLRAAGVTNVGYTQGDVGAGLPFPDAYFDIAVLIAVLGEIESQDDCLASLHRVIRAGGLLAVHEHIPDPDFIPFAHVRRLVEKHGFAFRDRSGRRWNYTATFLKPPSTGTV